MLCAITLEEKNDRKNLAKQSLKKKNNLTIKNLFSRQNGLEGK